MRMVSQLVICTYIYLDMTFVIQDTQSDAFAEQSSVSAPPGQAYQFEDARRVLPSANTLCGKVHQH